jgi:hypothetical protein
MQETKSHKQQVFEECHRIAWMAAMLAQSASRQFAAAVDAEDFETKDGPDYSAASRTLRIRVERILQSLGGIDAQLDEDLSDYTLSVLRADPRAVRPRFFRDVN